MRVLYLSPYVPYDGIGHAGGAFLHEYLVRLAARVDELVLVAPGTDANRRAAERADPSFELHLVPLPAYAASLPAKVVSFAYKTAKGLHPGLWLGRAFDRDPALGPLLRSADVVEIAFSELVPLVDLVRASAPSVPIAAFEHDVYFDLLDRWRRSSRSARLRASSLLAHRRARDVEVRALNRCDHVWVFSDRDKGLLRDAGVVTPIDLAEPWVEIPGQASGPAPTGEVLFVGDLGRPQNTEGVRWFVDEIWPSIRERAPDATFVVGGDRPPSWLRERSGSASGIRVTGYVEDLTGLYGRAATVVAPLRSGAGFKFKVVQAMAHGLPVVGTTVAADGYEAWGGLASFAEVTDDPTRFAGAVVRLLEDPAEARAVGARARSWVERTFDFDASVDRIASRMHGLTERHGC